MPGLPAELQPVARGMRKPTLPPRDLHLRISGETYKRLMKSAWDNERTVSAEARYAVRKHLERNEQ